MSNPITVKGYVCSVPRAADARQASVAVVQDDVEYRIIPRGAGADLADEVSALVEVTRSAAIRWWTILLPGTTTNSAFTERTPDRY